MRKNISISDNETEIIDHLNNHPNASRYIVELIRKDINNENDGLTKDKVIELIKQYGGINKNNSNNKIKSSLDTMFK